jgi:alpha-1,3-glucosyltransferase
VAALGFKQMALYYAPAMFAALLAACVNPQPRPKLFLSIALVTLLSFMLLLAPFVVAALIEGPVAGDKGDFLEVDLPFQSVVPLLSKLARDTTAWYFPPIQQLGQVIQRIFPFARGIFEDKVANVWCTLNVIVKLRHYPVALLQRASLVATLTSIVPPCTLIFSYPRSDLFLFATAATALGFFLFGFMVHEKSVLLPLLPMTLILGQRGGLTPAIRAWVGWANALGVWTMFPLLKRVDLSIPYFVLSLLWAYLLGLPPTSLSAYIDKRQPNDGGLHVATKLLHLSFYLYMILWHFAEAFIEPPKGKPDLWVVLNVAVGSAGFSICYLWCLWHCLRRAGIIGVGVDLTRSAKT